MKGLLRAVKECRPHGHLLKQLWQCNHLHVFCNPAYVCMSYLRNLGDFNWHMCSVEVMLHLCALALLPARINTYP